MYPYAPCMGHMNPVPYMTGYSSPYMMPPMYPACQNVYPRPCYPGVFPPILPGYPPFMLADGMECSCRRCNNEPIQILVTNSGGKVRSRKPNVFKNDLICTNSLSSCDVCTDSSNKNTIRYKDGVPIITPKIIMSQKKKLKRLKRLCSDIDCYKHFHSLEELMTAILAQMKSTGWKGKKNPQPQDKGEKKVEKKEVEKKASEPSDQASATSADSGAVTEASEE
ncbi:hypothetical protein HELRODRAFT_194417 [Helobdella robusta]|uniref:Uncharacterized protein n=1 Tax=Helobdella robusta TaxID=6412 RepID=T1FW13_HELRO|nr:hypothetical protein HELRODRAFT_194417 [Helobdella robusta]ESN92028.1 hypothetical protein HELRODRAFT_194417 [Helobdella robusta]